MNEAQHNYDIYNKELLGLWEMFKHWRQYLHQAAHKVIVHTDHANLLFWKNPGDHNRRVVQWHGDLMEYDFELWHIAGKKNGCADVLSRRPDYDTGDNNNKKLVVILAKYFGKAQAQVAGSEWANPANPEEWKHFLSSQEDPIESLHDQVEKDQQTEESKEQIKK